MTEFAFINTSGTHLIDETYFDKIVYCDCNNGKITLEFSNAVPAGTEGVVRFVRFEESGNDAATYVQLENIGNSFHFALPIEGDWLEVAYADGRWREAGGGQSRPKGFGGQHRTATASKIKQSTGQAWYRCHEGDRNAVIRCVSDVTPGMAVVLPTREILGRAQDYAASARIGVTLTRNNPANYIDVIPSGGYSIGGQQRYRIQPHQTDLTHWFEYHAGTQWFLEGTQNNTGYSP